MITDWEETGLEREEVELFWCTLEQANGSSKKMKILLDGLTVDKLRSLVRIRDGLVSELSGRLQDEAGVLESESTTEEYALCMIERGRNSYLKALNDGSRTASFESFLSSGEGLEIPLLGVLLETEEERLNTISIT